MIEVKNISKSYGDRAVLENLTFSIDDGKVHGILGPDGAGKSTVMNILTGCLSADEGSVSINGYDIKKNPMDVKKRIGYLPEIPPLYENMTVYEYLVFVAEAKRVSYGKLYKNVRSAMELTFTDEYKDRLIKNLSGGSKKRVGIAQALLGNPDIIILDEPISGLDTKQTLEIAELIKKLGEIKTVIVSGHVFHEISEICDDMMIISHGKLIAHDTLENLENSLSTTEALCVTVSGEEAKAISAVENIKGIKDIIVSRSNDGTFNFKIEYDTEIDVRSLISDALTEAECSVISMENKPFSLEDIYLKLTDSADSEKDKDGKKDEKGGGKAKVRFGKRGKN